MSRGRVGEGRRGKEREEGRVTEEKEEGSKQYIYCMYGVSSNVLL